MPGAAPQWDEVALSVYELHGTSAINLVTSATGLGGAYHVGVEVYGLEWSFGFAEDGTGIYMVHVGQSTLGNFLERVPLGRTKRDAEQVLDILDGLRRTWKGDSYSVLTKNCAHFSLAFAKLLGFNNAPAWINSLAGTGAALTGARNLSIQSQSAEDESLDDYDDDELQEFADDGDHAAMSELVWRQAQEYTRDWVEKAKYDTKYEDFLIEFRWVIPRDDDGSIHDAAQALTKDARLEQAIAQSTARALGLAWNRQSVSDLCPVKVTKIQRVAGMRISATCRVVGGRNTERLSRRPRPDSFAREFKAVLVSIMPWSRIDKALISNMQLDTTPGQTAASKRVQTSSGLGGEVYFSSSRTEFKPHEGMHSTLDRLQKLRGRLAEQTATYHALGSIHGSGYSHRYQNFAIMCN